MREFSSTYYLKPDTDIVDIYNCIRGIFKLPENVPKKYTIETFDSITIWNCSEEENGIVEFNYCYSFNDEKIELEIIFNKEINNNLHTLYYKETTTASDFKYLDHILASFKCYIPKTYIQKELISDKIFLQKTIHEYFQKIKNDNSLDDEKLYGLVDKAVNQFLNILVFPEFDTEFVVSTLKDENGNEKEVIKQKKTDVGIAIDKSKNQMPKSKNDIKIEFLPDTEGNYILSINEMKQLLSDLWYLNADFIISDGVLSILNIETLTKNIPEWRFNETKTKNIESKKKIFYDFRQNAIIEKKNYVNSVLHLEAPLIRISNDSYYYEITKIENINEPFSNEIKKEIHNYSYNEIKNKIIYSISDINSENDNTNFSAIMWNKKNEDEIVEAKVKYYLKSHNLEPEYLMNLSKENEELKGVVNQLKLQVEQSNDIIKKLKTELAVSNSSEDILITNTKISKLNKKISELETENNNLRQLDNQNKITIQTLKDSFEVKKNNNSVFLLEIPCSEKELYANEIQDYLYNTLYTAIAEDKEKLPHNKQTEVSRKRDVVEDLLNNKVFDFSASQTNNKINKIESILKASYKPDLEELQHEGFEKVENTKNHPKLYFYNRRYQMTFASTPSDERGCFNKMQEIKERFFL